MLRFVHACWRASLGNGVANQLGRVRDSSPVRPSAQRRFVLQIRINARALSAPLSHPAILNCRLQPPPSNPARLRAGSETFTRPSSQINPSLAIVASQRAPGAFFQRFLSRGALGFELLAHEALAHKTVTPPVLPAIPPFRSSVRPPPPALVASWPPSTQSFRDRVSHPDRSRAGHQAQPGDSERALRHRAVCVSRRVAAAARSVQELL